MGTKSFALPRDGIVYTETVFSRSRDFISYDVWSGVELHRLDQWIANFRTDEERYFAAKILDALIYRSDRQTIALMKHMFQVSLPDYSRQMKLPESLKHVYTSMKSSSTDPRIRVAPVLPEHSAPTKSGPTYTRDLKRHLRFSEKWLAFGSDAIQYLDQIDALIFIDDFLGTGQQFGEFLNASSLSKDLSRGNVIYAPLTGHYLAIERLRSDFPGLHVVPVEVLDEKHSFFSEQAGHFDDGINSNESALNHYHDLLKDRDIRVQGSLRQGYGGLELVYAFENAVPDNSLPILWWHQSDNWKPLFDR